MSTMLAWASMSSCVRSGIRRGLGITLVILLLLGLPARAGGQTTTGVTPRAGATLGDRVWEDLNENGVQDAGEPGLSQIPVNLLSGAGVLLHSTLTGSDGHYTFTGLAAGDYIVEFNRRGFRVELVWNTPGYPDQSDAGPEAGSDVDLHVAHPLADVGQDHDGDGSPDPWFDQPYDVFWFNPHPNWGTPEIGADDPSLDRDDTDGAGAEVISLRRPENNAIYRVGVHYWSDHRYGPSTATVRIYIDSTRVFSETANLVNHDLWDVATIAWPSGTVTAITQDGGKKITPAYPTPFALRTSAAMVAAATDEQYRFTAANQGADDTRDSDATTNGWSPVVSIGDGASNLTVDAGLIRVPGSSCVWLPQIIH